MLEVMLGSETILKRSDFLGLILFHKIHLQETSPLIRLCEAGSDHVNKECYGKKLITLL